MQNPEQNTEETTDYLYPEQRKVAIERLEQLEAELRERPDDLALRALVRKQQGKVKWYERKKGDRLNVGTTTLCSRPTRKKRASDRPQAQLVPPLGLHDLLPPA